MRKEADSAWLRFALDVVSFRGELDAKLRRHVVLGYRVTGEMPAGAIRRPRGSSPHSRSFPGFLCLDYAGGEAEARAMVRLFSGWREALSGKVVDPHAPS